MKKRLLSLLLALVMVFGLLPAVSAAETVASGTCGENLTWVLTDDGTLTISGEGDMRDFFDYKEWWGDGYTTIDIDAPWYDYVENITTLIVNEGITSIGGEAFLGYRKLSLVELPSSLLTIGKDAFAGCRSLTSITLPESLQSIGDEAFSNCGNLNSINLPEGLQSIGESAFFDCNNLNSITIPGSIVKWNDSFERSGLKTVTILDGVSEIPHDAFYYCSALEQITIPSSVKTIGQAAFSDCEKLVEIELPYGVEEIQAYAFIRCSNLAKITLSDTLTTIGDSAFAGCNKLESIAIPSNVAQIGNDVLTGSNLKAIHVDKANQYFSSDPIGVLYNKDKTELLQFPRGLRGYYAIPEGVTTLGNHAFSYAFVSALSIPASVTAFGSSTFFFNYNGFSIKDIYYAGSLEQWKLIECAYYDSGYNDGLDKARMHYNSTNPEEHPYVPSILAPTCTEQGCTTYTCSCGHSYIDDYVDTLGHDYKGGVCTRCAAEDPDYFNPFTDVPAGAWYEAPILWALENGVTSGTSDTTFSPGNQCLRAHVVTFLWNAEKCPEPAATASTFTDVPAGAWYEKPVLWAVENGITSGVSSSKFGAGDVCARYQVVYFLWKAAGAPEPETTVNPFTDVNPGHFFYKAVLWAVENGITSGTSDTTFSPAQPCNRAQVVTFLYKAYN